MRRSNRLYNACVVALALSFAATCVPLVEYDDRPCPCGSGYSCCESSNTCLPDDEYREESCRPAAAGASKGGSSGSSNRPDGGAGGTFTAGGAGNGSVDTSGNGGVAGVPAEAGSAGDGAGAGGAAGSGPVVHGPCDAYSRKANVLMLVYNPILESQGGVDLQAYTNVADARALAATLAQQLTSSSAGVVNYDIVEARYLSEWPTQLPGAQPLDEETFTAGLYDNVTYEDPPGGNADYAAIFAEQKLCEAVQQHDISEIWLWGTSRDQVSFGFEPYRYRLANGLPGNPSPSDEELYEARSLDLPDCGRTLWVMGFEYHLDASWAHRVYNERAGELIERALRTESLTPELDDDLWAHFSRFGAEGASVGTPWFPPNAGRDGESALADYDDLEPVLSDASIWFTYPDVSGAPSEIKCSAWDCSPLGFQSWYSFHIPRANGVASNGTCNNWWKYVADPDATLEACSGDACRPNAANGLPCASDSDCASGHCACDQTATICVEEAGDGCPRANWALCTTGDDCLSGYCGCNWDFAPKRCLPSSDYPLDCREPEPAGN
ncbi:MAG TPA: hypothetical protein VM686_32880 [Polyangiaceae bacterium]|nr:hypothetical protein [Polyangiaceae bacterium]